MPNRAIPGQKLFNYPPSQETLLSKINLPDESSAEARLLKTNETFSMDPRLFRAQLGVMVTPQNNNK